MPGIHWAALLPAAGPVAAAVVGLLSAVVVGALVWWLRQSRLPGDLLLVNAILAVWILLAVYHRNYDTFLAVLLVVYGVGLLTTRVLAPRQALGLVLFLAGAVAVLCLPGEVVARFMSAEQAERFVVAVDRMLTWTLTAMLGVGLALLGQRTHQAPVPVQAGPQQGAVA
jgi:hypothetical protein